MCELNYYTGKERGRRGLGAERRPGHKATFEEAGRGQSRRPQESCGSGRRAWVSASQVPVRFLSLTEMEGRRRVGTAAGVAVEPALSSVDEHQNTVLSVLLAVVCALSDRKEVVSLRGL